MERTFWTTVSQLDAVKRQPALHHRVKGRLRAFEPKPVPRRGHHVDR